MQIFYTVYVNTAHVHMYQHSGTNILKIFPKLKFMTTHNTLTAYQCSIYIHSKIRVIPIGINLRLKRLNSHVFPFAVFCTMYTSCLLLRRRGREI